MGRCLPVPHGPPLRRPRSVRERERERERERDKRERERERLRDRERETERDDWIGYGENYRMSGGMAWFNSMGIKRKRERARERIYNIYICSNVYTI
jgi:hypothetical protein